MSRLKDKVAIITGGSQGIGREYALRFAREGAKVVIGDIREAQAQEVVQEIAKLGSEGLALRTDVSKEEDTQRLAAATHEHFGRIDVLVNNAAIYYDLDRNQNTLAYFNRVLSVNLTGAWLMSRAVERHMKRQRRGKIIHQSSTAAYLGNVGMVDTEDPDAADAAVPLQRGEDRRRGAHQVHGRRARAVGHQRERDRPRRDHDGGDEEDRARRDHACW